MESMRVVRLCYYLSYLRIYDNNGNGGSIRDVDTVISFPSVYPYRISDISLPSDSTGFVYMLVSVKDCSRTHVGQMENIRKWLYQHNKGWGAVGTANPQYRPYAVAAYICGMGHMNRVEREGIEKSGRFTTVPSCKNPAMDKRM